ncbi:MAG: hypothetical protein LBT33_08155 [Spirochaetia bacterium]|jgi:hypothetical protein|nr:hypothetical protein [Spirochaetia bacterium]
MMAGAREFDDEIFLNMVIRKSAEEKTDENGNFIFEVEASNENLDLQGQTVLQQALLGSKEHFLENGVISYDHLHKRRGTGGEVIPDTAMIIGEPIDVKTDGKRTIVVGKLYRSNETARDIIKKLKDGSTRIRASVGGIFPKVVRDAKTGIEKIVSVLWNDLALTFAPVNPTVSPVDFARGMSSFEFVKALAAQSGTGHAGFAGGRALIGEDVDAGTQDVTEGADENLGDAIRGLMAALCTGEVSGRAEAVGFLVRKGISGEQARAAVREISNFKESGK